MLRQHHAKMRLLARGQPNHRIDLLDQTGAVERAGQRIKLRLERHFLSAT